MGLVHFFVSIFFFFDFFFRQDDIVRAKTPRNRNSRSETPAKWMQLEIRNTREVGIVPLNSNKIGELMGYKDAKHIIKCILMCATHKCVFGSYCICIVHVTRRKPEKRVKNMDLWLILGQYNTCSLTTCWFVRFIKFPIEWCIICKSITCWRKVSTSCGHRTESSSNCQDWSFCDLWMSFFVWLVWMSVCKLIIHISCAYLNVF